MSDPKRSRPAANRAANKSSTNDTFSLADLDELAEHVDGAFVLVVKLTGGRSRRRVYLTAKAAERAVARATEAGHDSRIYLAELKPLRRVVGGGCR